ncbi:MAG: hypothetical protein L0I76_30990 [Pseudonocardia sp.]|nr:hypothetical protein [Pseudonocardia sp.]
MNWIDTLEVLCWFVVVVLSVLAYGRYGQLTAQLNGQAVELECVRRQLGITDEDVREYHWREHPDCRPEGEL